MPKSCLVSHPIDGNVALRREGNSFCLSNQIADGYSSTSQINPNLFLTESELTFEKNTIFHAQYLERQLFQISFCLSGTMEWNYGESGSVPSYISPAESSIQSGTFFQCESCYQAGVTYRDLSITLNPERYPELHDCFSKAGMLNNSHGICTRIFSSTPRIRLLLQQLQESPPEHSLRRLYLEGKVLELLAVYCDEVVLQKATTQKISKEDYCCLLQARDLIDRQFIYPLTIAQIANASCISETKLKQGFKTCFGCTVYEYIVEKRMEMAHKLLGSGQYKVKDVVWMVGYSNASHFIEQFRKRYGINPGDV